MRKPLHQLHQGPCVPVERLRVGGGRFGEPGFVGGWPWRAGSWLFVPLRPIPGAPNGTAMLNLGVYPPEERVLPVNLWDAAPHPEGGWLLAGQRTPGGAGEAWRCSEEELADPAACPAGAPIQSGSRLAALGGEVFGLADEDEEPVPLLRLAGGAAGPVAEIPPSRGVLWEGRGPYHAIGSVRLGDGGEALLWGGHGWERSKNGRFRRTFSLNAASDLHLDPVPAGSDGFFYLHRRQVFRARRGEAPRRALPWAERVMRLAPGPDGSLLLDLGPNKRSLALAVAFPQDGSFIPLRRKDLGGPRPGEPIQGFFWSEPTGRLFTAGEALIALDAAEILARRRVRPR